MSDMITSYSRYAPYARAGLRGARRLYGMYNNTLIPDTPLTRVQKQVRLLGKTVAQQRPQLSNWVDSATLSCPQTAVTSQDYSLTSRFIASSGSGAYDDLVLGDKYTNVKTQLRFDISLDLPRVRVIVYWAKKAGNTLVISNFWNTPDPSAFVVLFDRTYAPIGVTATSAHNVRSVNLLLGNKITNYNESSSVLENGDLRMLIIAENTSASAKAIAWSSRLFIRNK